MPEEVWVSPTGQIFHISQTPQGASMKTWGPCKKEDIGKIMNLGVTHATFINVNHPPDKPSTCYQCRFYKMIDSGYGWCVRLPPVRQKVVIRAFVE